MGQDYLHLEAIRGTTVDDVGRVITRALEKKGWKAGETDDLREIRIAALGDWIVVVDREEEKPPAVWAKSLSKALGGTAISARSWSDYGEIEIRRFDAGVLRGELTAKFDEPVEAPYDLAFLADLAPARARTKLAKLTPKETDHPDDVLERIAKLGGLPMPLDRYTDLGAELHLGFYRPMVDDHPSAERPADASPARQVKGARETFERTYHVRAPRADVVRAIRDELATKGIRPRRAATDDLEREVFLRERGGWCSVGETQLRSPTLGYSGVVSWGEVLSKRLGKQVLVAEPDPFFALTVCSDGAEGAPVYFPGCIDDVRKTADVQALAIIVSSITNAVDLGAIPVGRDDVFTPSIALARVTKHFGLEDPLFAKPFDGVVLSFT